VIFPATRLGASLSLFCHNDVVSSPAWPICTVSGYGCSDISNATCYQLIVNFTEFFNMFSRIGGKKPFNEQNSYAIMHRSC